MDSARSLSVEKKTGPGFKKALAVIVGYSFWVLAAFMGVQLVVGFLLAGLRLSGVSFQQYNEAVVSAGLSIVVYSLTIAVTLWGPRLLKRGASLKELGLQRSVKMKDFGIFGVGLVSYLVLTTIISSLAMVLLPFIDFDEVQTTGFETITSNFEYVLAFWGLVVIAPVAEEVLFRGFLFGKLRAAKVKLWLSVLIVSLLFAVVHFQGNVGIDVFALSIVLCMLRVWSGSLWPSIMLHMAKNGVAFYFLFINPAVLSTLGG